MAFGLCNAPATFQRVIQLILRGLTWDKILAYLDEVIVLGKNFQDHIKNLRPTFERFTKYNLKLKPKKRVLFQTKTTFLGRIVSSEGVGVNPSDCYRAGSDPKSLPCAGCKHCLRAHNQWSRFSEEVDDVPLAVRTVNLVKPVSRSVPWITGYTTSEMSEIQSSDPCLGKLTAWISSEEPEQRELYLSSPAVKHSYICRKQLLYKDGLLYYKWKEEAGDRLLLMVADKLKQEVMSLNHDIPLPAIWE